MVQAADEWRGTTVQVCGLWPYAVGTGAPMIGVPLGRSLLTGATVCGDPISWFQRARLINNPSVFLLGLPALGKALDVDTLIPTPAGMTRMGDLHPGDYVIGGDGRPTPVVAATDVMEDRPCFELTFSTGERIVADAEHLWVTRTAADRRRVVPSAARRSARYQPLVTAADRAALVEARAALPEHTTRRAVARALGWDDARLARLYTWTEDMPADDRGVLPASDVLDRVEERLARAERRIRGSAQPPITTAAIAATLTDSGKTNHSIPVTGPIDFGVETPFEQPVCGWCGGRLPAHRGGPDLKWCSRSCKDRALHHRRSGYGSPVAPSGRSPSALPPVPPYTLGYWLGDGTRGTSNITTADPQVVDIIAADGCTATRTAGPLRYRVRLPDGTSLAVGLRRLGVLDKKAVPASYLRASIDVRRALLAGLLDSDGTVSACGGQVQFTSTSAQLAEQVVELVASLGYRPALFNKPARLNGRDCGTAWQVGFSAPTSPFRLDRKSTSHAARSTFQPRRNTDRYIVDVRPVASRPVRCIQVASDDGLYQVGRTFITTHNSTLVRRMALGLAGYGVIPLVLGDLKPDYVDLIEALGGQVITLGRGRGSLNVLDPGEAVEAAERLRAAGHEKAAATVMADAHGRRHTMVSALLTILRKQPPSDVEESIVDQGLRLLDRRLDRVPVLADLLRVVQEAPAELREVAVDRGSMQEYQRISRGLEASLISLTRGDRLGETFAKPTTNPMRRDRPVVYDVSALPESDSDLQAAVLLACWSAGFATVNVANVLADAGLEPRRHYFVILDELWRALRAGKGMVDRIDSLTRLNRTRGVGMAMVSHTMSDLLSLTHEEDRMKARGFVERSGMVICGGLPPAEMPKLNEALPFSRVEQDMMIGWSDPPSLDPITGRETEPPGRGKFLIKVGGRPGIPVKVELTDAEYAINDTNRLWHTQSRVGNRAADQAVS